MYPTGSVYVLENPTAERVKVGMTGIGVNDVADRLRDVNDMWLDRRVTCQVCGRRIKKVEGLVPPHPTYGNHCPGSNALPLEESVQIATTQLANILSAVDSLKGNEKASATRRAKTLAQRVRRYSNRARVEGEWRFYVAYYTDGPWEVEALVHRKLSIHRDVGAPFGEVFSCSAAEAEVALKASMEELGVRPSAKRRAQL